jgi:hypothetical protein
MTGRVQQRIDECSADPLSALVLYDSHRQFWKWVPLLVEQQWGLMKDPPNRAKPPSAGCHCDDRGARRVGEKRNHVGIVLGRKGPTLQGAGVSRHLDEKGLILSRRSPHGDAGIRVVAHPSNDVTDGEQLD